MIVTEKFKPEFLAVSYTELHTPAFDFNRLNRMTGINGIKKCDL